MELIYEIGEEPLFIYNSRTSVCQRPIAYIGLIGDAGPNSGWGFLQWADLDPLSIRSLDLGIRTLVIEKNWKKDSNFRSMSLVIWIGLVRALRRIKT